MLLCSESGCFILESSKTNKYIQWKLRPWLIKYQFLWKCLWMNKSLGLIERGQQTHSLISRCGMVYTICNKNNYEKVIWQSVQIAISYNK